MNTITITGNLTSDLVTRYTSSGQPVVNTSIASNRRAKVNNNWQDELNGFFDLTIWGDLGLNAAASLKKGDRVTLTGEMRTNEYEKDGQQHRRWVVHVRDIAPSLRFHHAVPVPANQTHQAPPPSPPASDPVTSDAPF